MSNRAFERTGHSVQETLITSGAILAYLVLTQYGRRRFSWHKWLPSLVAIPPVAVAFLHEAPTTRADVLVYAVSTGLGVGLGLLATATTGVHRDPGTGRLYTQCGLAFFAVWVVALGSRVLFVWGLVDSAGFQRFIGRLMLEHQIAREAIAPTFVLLALAMFATRIGALLLISRRRTARRLVAA